MSDRREAVAKAIYDVDRAVNIDVCEPGYYAKVADAAIAAMQATEPTEAEVEAAAKEYEQAWNRIWGRPACGDDDVATQQCETMRAALMAARTAAS